jgi:hypothetical protein
VADKAPADPVHELNPDAYRVPEAPPTPEPGVTDVAPQVQPAPVEPDKGHAITTADLAPKTDKK